MHVWETYRHLMALCLLVSTEGWAELKASTWHYETPVLECSCYWERQARTKTSRMECSSYAVAPPLTCTRTSCYMCYFMNAFDRFEQAATLSFELDGCGHLCEILWNKMQWHSKQDCLLAIQDVARAWDQTRDEILEIVQIQSPDRIDPHQLAFHLTLYLTYILTACLNLLFLACSDILGALLFDIRSDI